MSMFISGQTKIVTELLASIHLVFTSKDSPENINCGDGLCCRDRFTGGSSCILAAIKCVRACVCGGACVNLENV